MQPRKPNFGGLIVIGLLFYWLWSGGGVSLAPSAAPTVLIVKDTATQSGLPGAMTDSWNAKAVLDWAEQNCARDADGSVSFKVLDKDFDLSQIDLKYLQLLKDHPPERLPWLYISSGAHGTQGDPRPSIAEFLAELEKWRPR
jgi:hypothetical protein